MPKVKLSGRNIPIWPPDFSDVLTDAIKPYAFKVKMFEFFTKKIPPPPPTCLQNLSAC
jgi:hypothetical protein